MKKAICGLLVSICFIAKLAAAAEVAPFDAEKTRASLLELLNTKENTEIIIEPSPLPGSQEEAFINFYFQHIKPVHDRLSPMWLAYSVYNQLFDAGLYTSAEERDLFQKKSLEIMAEVNKLSSDPKWEELQLKWGQLAEGLPGELAQTARQNASQLKFSQYSPEFLPVLNQIDTFDQEIDKIVNTSPFMIGYQQGMAKSSNTLRQFFAGEISFATAATQLEEISLNGSLAFGHDIVTKAQTQLNERAKLLSRLAKTKGFKTHAQMRVAAQGIAHVPQFQDKDSLLQFLWSLLEQTEPVMREYYELRAMTVAKRPLQSLNSYERRLLGNPTNLLVRDYFPSEKLVEIWRRTMLESGFREADLAQIIVDAYPRENKNNHAYMRAILTPSPGIIKINGRNLAQVEISDWQPAFIYILQNFVMDGLSQLSTGFHEGGHGFDYAYQRDAFGLPRAYGYSETHSTTLETFMEDKEFILASGETREGLKITPEVVDLYLKRKAVLNIEGFRGTVSSTIFDILLWDYDYETGDETFIERALKIARELDVKAEFLESDKEHKIDPGYSYFVTNHFYSGMVRNYGYVLAEVSAGLVSEALTERLKALTGRSTWYHQPQIAQILGEGLYRRGFEKPFPETIEQFTGKKFSADTFAQTLVRSAQAYVQELKVEACASTLK